MRQLVLSKIFLRGGGVDQAALTPHVWKLVLRYKEYPDGQYSPALPHQVQTWPSFKGPTVLGQRGRYATRMLRTTIFQISELWRT